MLSCFIVNGKSITSRRSGILVLLKWKINVPITPISLLLPVDNPNSCDPEYSKEKRDPHVIGDFHHCVDNNHICHVYISTF